MPRLFTRFHRRPILLTVAIAASLALPLGIAIASHQFSDVPPDDTYHADVAALVATGVTAGCGGGKYCPAANVTREQMAAFMNRLGALAPGKRPVVNAARLEGLDSRSFHRYSATAPAGRTQYGGFSAQGSAEGAGALDAAVISFPVPLSAAPTARIILPGQALPPGCSGSVVSPGAAPGNLCIFVGWQLNADSSSFASFSVVSGLPGASRFGAALQVLSAGSGNFAVTGSWAVNGGGSTLQQDVTEGAGTRLGE